MIFAIDFDDTIHDTKSVPQGKKLGCPVEGAKESIAFLRDQGHKVIIFSYWATSDKVKIIEDWCVYFGIAVDEITNIKPKAHFYIDNLSVHFQTWNQTLREIDKRLQI